MKSTNSNLTLFLPLLLLLLATAGPSTAAPARVIDVDGHPVNTRHTYYILPLIRGNGGGLSLGPRNASLSCPLYVTQEPQEVSRGLPVRFFTVNATSNVTVRVSTDMNIEFDAATICVQSTVWRLGGVEGPAEEQRRFVQSGGVKGNPGPRTLSNWFKIEKLDEASKSNYYKLVFCPNVCNFCKVVCGDLGVFREDDGKRFLGLAPQIQPLGVIFKKAT